MQGYITPQRQNNPNDEIEHVCKTWRIYFTREFQHRWKNVASCTAYIIILVWTLRLTWHLFAGHDHINIDHINMHQMLPIQSIGFFPQDLNLRLQSVQLREQDLTLQLTFSLAAYLTPGHGQSFRQFLKEILVEVLSSKGYPPCEDLIQLECQFTLEEINTMGTIQVCKKQTKAVVQKFADILTAANIREAFVNHAGMQKLLKNILESNLQDIGQHEDAGLAQKMRYIVKGIPSAKQMFMMSSNQLISGVRYALERTRNELVEGFLGMESLQQDADTYRKNLTVLEEKIVAAENKLIAAEKQLNQTIQQSQVHIKNMHAENVEQRQQEKLLLHKISELEQDTKNLTDSRRKLQKIADEKKKMIKHLEEEMKTNVKKQKKGSEMLEVTRDNLNKLQEQNSVLKKQQKQFQDTIINIAIMSEIIAKNSNLSHTASISQILQTLKDLENNNNELNKKINENLQQGKIKEELLHWQENKLKELNFFVSKQQDEIMTLNEEYNRLKQNLTEADQKTGSNEDIIRDLESQIALLKVDLQQSLLDMEQKMLEWKQQRSVFQSYRELFDMMRFFTGQFTQKHDQIKEQEENVSTSTPINKTHTFHKYANSRT